MTLSTTAVRKEISHQAGPQNDLEEVLSTTLDDGIVCYRDITDRSEGQRHHVVQNIGSRQVGSITERLRRTSHFLYSRAAAELDHAEWIVFAHERKVTMLRTRSSAITGRENETHLRVNRQSS